MSAQNGAPQAAQTPTAPVDDEHDTAAYYQCLEIIGNDSALRLKVMSALDADKFELPDIVQFMRGTMGPSGMRNAIARTVMRATVVYLEKQVAERQQLTTNLPAYQAASAQQAAAAAPQRQAFPQQQAAAAALPPTLHTPSDDDLARAVAESRRQAEFDDAQQLAHALALSLGAEDGDSDEKKIEYDGKEPAKVPLLPARRTDFVETTVAPAATAAAAKVVAATPLPSAVHVPSQAYGNAIRLISEINEVDISVTYVAKSSPDTQFDSYAIYAADVMSNLLAMSSYLDDACKRPNAPVWLKQLHEKDRRRMAKLWEGPIAEMRQDVLRIHEQRLAAQSPSAARAMPPSKPHSE